MDSSTKGGMLERKGTMRSAALGSQKVQEVSIIDSCLMYNILLRSIQLKTKNSFIIYDFSPPEMGSGFQGENVIRVCEHADFCQALLQGPPEKIKLPDLQKLLSKPKDDLFSKRTRFYNFIVIAADTKNHFFPVFQSVMNTFFHSKSLVSTASSDQIQNQPIRFWDALLTSGQHKVNEKEVSQAMEKAILNVPGLGDSKEVNSWRMAIAFQSALKANKITEVQFYRQSSSHFFSKYPFMREYLSSLNLTTTLTYPNEVFCGRFYYGNWKHASSKEVFEHAGITHVVNVTQEVENYFEESDIPVKYLRIHIEDIDEANISEHFSKAFYFLTEALSQKNTKVFVHCAQGKSRSATIVCLFFMRIFQWSYDDAIKYVSERRDLACPNHGFDDQLQTFQSGGFLFKGESNFQDFSDENNIQDGEINEIGSEYSNHNKKEQSLCKRWYTNLNAQILREIDDEDYNQEEKEK